MRTLGADRPSCSDCSSRPQSRSCTATQTGSSSSRDPSTWSGLAMRESRSKSGGSGAAARADAFGVADDAEPDRLAAPWDFVAPASPRPFRRHCLLMLAPPLRRLVVVSGGSHHGSSGRGADVHYGGRHGCGAWFQLFGPRCVHLRRRAEVACAPAADAVGAAAGAAVPLHRALVPTSRAGPDCRCRARCARPQRRRVGCRRHRGGSVLFGLLVRVAHK